MFRRRLQSDTLRSGDSAEANVSDYEYEVEHNKSETDQKYQEEETLKRKEKTISCKHFHAQLFLVFKIQEVIVSSRNFAEK